VRLSFIRIVDPKYSANQRCQRRNSTARWCDNVNAVMAYRAGWAYIAEWTR